MALQKQTISFNFAKGIDTLTDANQLSIGKFTSLTNAVFVQNDEGGALNKRNGFNQITSLGSCSFITTYNQNLLGVQYQVNAFSQSINSFVPSGQYFPLNVSVMSLIKNMFSQSNVDMQISSSSGLICLTYNSGDFFGGMFRYAILDANTGQSIQPATNLVSSGGGEVFPPRVFTLNNRFVILYDSYKSQNTVSSSFFLQYVTIPFSAPNTVSSTQVISSNGYFTSNACFDASLLNNSLYVAWNGGDSLSQKVYAATINSAFHSSGITDLGTTPGQYRELVVATAVDTSGSQTFWAGRGITMSSGLELVATNPSLQPLYYTPNTNNQLITGSLCSGSLGIMNFTMTTNNSGHLIAFVEGIRVYPYYAAAGTQNNTFSDSIDKLEIIGIAGSATSNFTTTVVSPMTRSLGIGSRPFYIGNSLYIIAAYSSQYQSSYYLINSSGLIAGRFAYGNGGGYLASTQNNTAQVYLPQAPPSVFVVGSSATYPYLFKDSIASVNKATNAGSSTQIAGIYSNLGINAMTLNFGSNNIYISEIGGNLNLSGGFLWSYDGFQLAENNFFAYPENAYAISSSSFGALTPQTYYYIATYEWTDNQGNIFRSAPSVPQITTVQTATSANIVYVPTCRLSYKNFPYSGYNNPIRIVIYRWSQAQQIYYQTLSVVQTSSVLTSDLIAITDGNADSAITGNQILYTNGGVVEDVGTPPVAGLTTFDTRLWLIDAEDPNLLWFSKQIIEATPVEMSDLFTYYVPPVIAGTAASSGPVRAISAMDDKLILFKANVIAYINGQGPDNTGAQNQYSSPILIANGVGCTNPMSIVLTPTGIMFQSDKGIWRLGRDLSMNFIGAAVEAFNSANVTSALTIPGTNQVRFTIDSSSSTLVYDYFAQEWDQFVGNPAVMSTLYNQYQTTINKSGVIAQETPGVYADVGTATTMSFKTGWINLSNMQGYMRAYRMYILGTFYSPHTYNIGIAYDYNPSIVQSTTINPTNSVGSGSIVEQWQVNFDRQSCQSFQLTFQEVASSSAGYGLTISGIKLVVGMKKDYARNIPATNKIG